jgi:hypothetical protein
MRARRNQLWIVAVVRQQEEAAQHSDAAISNGKEDGSGPRVILYGLHYQIFTQKLWIVPYSSSGSQMIPKIVRNLH